MTLTQTEYAAIKGWSRQYVSKLAKQGRLVLDDAGKIDEIASDALIAKTADPSKEAVAERHLQDRVEKLGPGHSLPIIKAVEHISDAAPEAIDFHKARARREHFQARIAENLSRKSDGELVERGAVEVAAFTTARQLRDLLLGLPKQISAELAAINDAWELERFLTTSLRNVLDDAERMSAADLGHLLDTPE